MRRTAILLSAALFLIPQLLQAQTEEEGPLSNEEFFARQSLIQSRIKAIREQLAEVESGEPGEARRKALLAELNELERQSWELQSRFFQPDTTSPYWKPITEELGLMIFRDEFDRARGTLFVKVGKYWKPIALDSVEELGPLVLPGEGG